MVVCLERWCSPIASVAEIIAVAPDLGAAIAAHGALALQIRTDLRGGG